MTGRQRSGRWTSWLSGLAVGAAGGFLMLEFPFLGLLICGTAAFAIWRKGRAVAGGAGLFVGIGGIWLVLFGQIALTCGANVDDAGCYAPDIGSAVAASAGVLVLGLARSILVAVQSRAG